MQTTRFGRDGETAAEKYLEGKGYHFLTRNFKLPTAKVIERNGKPTRWKLMYMAMG